MPLVLVEGAVIMCGHGGQVKLTGGSGKVSVDGSGILVSGAEADVDFTSAPVGELAACTATTPGGSPQPCKSVAATAGIATNLTVGGTPALLATAKGVTASGAGPSTWVVDDAGQKPLAAS